MTFKDKVILSTPCCCICRHRVPTAVRTKCKQKKMATCMRKFNLYKNFVRILTTRCAVKPVQFRRFGGVRSTVTAALCSRVLSRQITAARRWMLGFGFVAGSSICAVALCHSDNSTNCNYQFCHT